MKFITVITALFASSLVTAAPAPVPVSANGDAVVAALGYKRDPVSANGDAVVAALGYKRDPSSGHKEDLGYKRDVAPAAAITAKKDKRHCTTPLKA
jgi:hypothetical protein